MATPLVGRAAELEWLRAHWQRARAGAGGLVLVAGERGIGKARLVAKLADQVLREHAAVLYRSAQQAPEALDAAGAAEGPPLVIIDRRHRRDRIGSDRPTRSVPRWTPGWQADSACVRRSGRTSGGARA